MAKVLSVYLNDYDEKMLSDLCNRLEITEESRAMKVALNHVVNDHTEEKPSEKPIVDTRPLLEQLKELLRECVKEIKEEQSPKTETTSLAVVDLETGKLETKRRIL